MFFYVIMKVAKAKQYPILCSMNKKEQKPARGGLKSCRGKLYGARNTKATKKSTYKQKQRWIFVDKGACW